MAFKYSLSCTGTKENKERFLQDLTKLGYKLKSNYGSGASCKYIVVNGVEGSTTLKNREFLYYNNILKRDYEFNIDNEWEYKAALAIASIREGEEFHEWEYIKAIKGYTTGNYWFETGSIFPIEKITKWSADDKLFTMKSIKGNIGDTGAFHFNEEKIAKATPEELIEHFKPKEMSADSNKSGNKYVIGVDPYRIEDEFVLPERWAFKAKTDLEASIFRGWLPKDIASAYPNWEIITSFFCYPNSDNYKGFKIGAHTDSTKCGGSYTEITFEQFKKYVLKENNMDKKIIGYNLKDQKFKNYASQIVFGNNYWVTKSGGYEIPVDNTQKLKDLGVLDLWFEPVYEEEKKIARFSIGSPSKDVVITGASIEIWKRIFSIGDVERVKRVFETSNYGILGFSSTGVYVKKVWIGCQEEGTEVTPGDISKIIENYKEVNP